MSDGSSDLSHRKKLVFTLIALLLPFVFLVVLEFGLRTIGYRDGLQVFEEHSNWLKKKSKTVERKFIEINPGHLERYTIMPLKPLKKPFLKDKPDTEFRIFTLGGSTTAGSPYYMEVTFPNILENLLNETLEEREVNVVNLGIGAMNSYALQEYIQKMIPHEPDAILMYSGHNEYAGPLGIVSNPYLGRFPRLVRFHLWLQNFRTYWLVKDSIYRLMETLGIFYHQSPEADEKLRFIKRQDVPYKSSLYELGVRQFRSNLSVIAETVEEENIPFFAGSVASNLKDQKPLRDYNYTNYPSARTTYKKAQDAYRKEEFDKARRLFGFARDLDTFRFRAPSPMNRVIRQLADKPEVRYVPVLETLRNRSEGGVLGNDLFVDLIHFNAEGYYRVARTFATDLLQSDLLQASTDSEQLLSWPKYHEKYIMTDFVDRYAFQFRLRRYTRWPFHRDKRDAVKSDSPTFEPRNRPEELADKYFSGELNWPEARIQLARYYESREEYDRAMRIYNQLNELRPWDSDIHTLAGLLRLKQGNLAAAAKKARKAIVVNKTPTAVWLRGIVSLKQGEPDKAIQLFEEVLDEDPNDAQLIAQTLFNLCGARLTKKQFNRAREACQKLKGLNPNYRGLDRRLRRIEELKASAQ